VFLVAVVVLAALAVPLAGGRLGALVEIRLRHVWASFAALGLEIAAMELPGLPEGLRATLLVAAYPVGRCSWPPTGSSPGCRPRRRPWPEPAWEWTSPGSRTRPP
jgi:hypothetical protein